MATTASRTFIHYPERPEYPTPEFVRGEYARLIARIGDAEEAAGAGEWVSLIGDWNALKSYLFGEQSRLVEPGPVGADAETSRHRRDAFIADILPVAGPSDRRVLDAILGSRHRHALEERYGRHIFERLDREIGGASAEGGEVDARLISALVHLGEIEKSMVSTIEGRPVGRAEIWSLLRSPDASVRRAAFGAMHESILERREELAAAVDRIVALRDEKARALGYRDAVQAGYAEMGRTWFGPEDVARLRQNIERHLRPVAVAMMRAHASRLGAERLHIADLMYDPARTLLRGVTAPVDTFLDRVGRLFDELSPRLAAHYRQLREWGLIDIEDRAEKGGGACCYQLPDEGRVGITMSARGDSGDLMVLLHECGHAFQKLESADLELLELRSPPGDFAEVHSTTMEHLGLRCAHHVMPEEHVRVMRRSMLANAVTTICATARIDEYQHWLYAHPSATAGEREAFLVGIEPKYADEYDWSGFEHLRISRPYELAQIYYVPFRMIDYSLARIVAMQIAMIDETDRDRAMEIYLELCRIGGSLSLDDALDRVGLRSPFDEGALADLASSAARSASK